MISVSFSVPLPPSLSFLVDPPYLSLSSPVKKKKINRKFKLGRNFNFNQAFLSRRDIDNKIKYINNKIKVAVLLN